MDVESDEYTKYKIAAIFIGQEPSYAMFFIYDVVLRHQK